MRYILQREKRGRESQEVWDGDVRAGERAVVGRAGESQNRNKKKVSVLTAGAAVSLLLPLLFAPSPATAAAGADLDLLLLLLLGRAPKDEVRPAPGGRRAPTDRRAGTGA